MIGNLFERLRDMNRAALAPFIECGDPDMDFTERLIAKACESGADIIELGVPFSDPMADGPVIQAASNRALAGGANLPKIFDMTARLRSAGVDRKFVLFSYLNPLFKFGIERAAELSAESGIDAWLVVDAPLEESREVGIPAAKCGLDFIPLASATTPIDRVSKISDSGSGFLYYVTVAGVTGARSALPESFAKRLAEVRAASRLPVAAGFGISTPEMARAAAASADAVVVGSAFVGLVHSVRLASGEAAALEAAGDFISSFASAVRR
ncbi:MAG: tryptophan synthase subunit alpha [Verrucomicrobia bacterium]|nr:MAG: tryptophan synthase subunit alpha [Verrucomicrobiota bacterium]